MSYLSNLHTHTTYCDGVSTAEEIVLRAIDKGYDSIGFSGHSYGEGDEDWCMSPEGTVSYRNEISALKKKYEGKIQVYLGIEQDFYSGKPDFGYDFVIGSVHKLKVFDGYCAVDNTSAIAENAVNKYFGGDWLAYAEEYYATVKNVVKITECDVVGHFDVVTKFNEGGFYFDENSKRYKDAAIDALETVIKECNLFEVNTGAIYRRKRSVPYPSEFLLTEIKARDGEIVFSSDSHNADSLGYMFEEAAELAKRCGFRYAKIMKNGKFENILI